MDLDSFLVSLYVLVDDWWKAKHSSEPPRVGRPALLADSEVITLAILAQWPRFSSERDFWRFASSHLRSYFPTLCSQSQFNRRVRALEPELRALQLAFSRELAEPSAVYRVLDTTLVAAMVRVRASRKGLFCGQATFGRSASKTEWVYGFKVALVVDPEGRGERLRASPCVLGRETHRGGPHSRRSTRGLPGGQRLHGDRVGAALAGGLRGTGGRHPEEQLPSGMVEGRSPLGIGQAPDHRGGDRPAQGLLLSGAPPGQDPERAADPPGGQDRGVHLWATDQRFPGPTAAPPGGPVGLIRCTSAVLGTHLRAGFFAATLPPWNKEAYAEARLPRNAVAWLKTLSDTKISRLDEARKY